jgi:hypothetical protein
MRLANWRVADGVARITDGRISPIVFGDEVGPKIGERAIGRARDLKIAIDDGAPLLWIGRQRKVAREGASGERGRKDRGNQEQ